MEGVERFGAVADRLLQEGRAYRCYCTPEELEDRRRAALKAGETPGYDGRCRRLSDAEREAFERERRPSAVRFAMSGNDITVHDLIRGDDDVPRPAMEDFVILRSNGVPTYLLAAACDDVRMGMTHVIRGEDLMPSTPRQLEMMQALGAPPPAYAHLPLIVGPDGQQLSKRFHAVAVERFREDGHPARGAGELPRAAGLVQGRQDHVPDARRDDRARSTSRASRATRRCSTSQKLAWMNGHYIRETPDERLAAMIEESLRDEGVEADAATVAEALPLIKERMQTIAEAAPMLRFLFEDVEPDEKARGMLGPDRAEQLRRGDRGARGADGLEGRRHPRGAQRGQGTARPVLEAGVPARAGGHHRHARVAAAVRVDGAAGARALDAAAAPRGERRRRDGLRFP